MTQRSPRPTGTVTAFDPAYDSDRMIADLGPLSSHPAHSLLRAIVWAGVAVAPLLAGVALVACWLYDGSTDPMQFLINNGRAILLYGLAATGFAMGFGLTALATTVATRSQMLNRDTHVSLGVVLAILAAIFILGMAVWAVPLVTSASGHLRLLVAWLGLLPLALLMSLATFLPHEDSAGNLVRRPAQLWTLIFPAAVISLVVATRAGAVSDWLQRFTVIQTPLNLFVEAIASSGFSHGSMDTIRSWIVTCLAGVMAAPLLGLALAAMNLVRIGTRAAVAVAESAEAGSCPAWLNDVEASLASSNDGDSQVVIQAEPGANTPHASAADPCHDFFAESLATVDQAEAFKQMVSLVQEAMTAATSATSRANVSADFVLEGTVASGKTATLIAAILHGAIVRGETTLLLVPNGEKREGLVTRVKLATRKLRSDGYIAVAELDPNAPLGWAGPRDHEDRATGNGDRVDSVRTTLSTGSDVPDDTHHPAGVVLPRVLVGTLEDFEQSFFRSPYDFSVRRQLLCSIGTVAVDDLDSFSVGDRIHLPYVLARLRLLLATDGQRCRTLLVSQPLALAARQLVARQLLGSGVQNGFGMRLRELPIPDASAVFTRPLVAVRSTAGSVGTLLGACGHACVSHGLSVAIVAPTGRTSLDEIRTRCSAGRSVADDQTICVVSHVDALSTLGTTEHGVVAAAMVAALKSRADGVVVAWRSGDPKAVAFFVEGLPESKDEPLPQHALMVLPGKESESLFAQHYASVARFLPRLQPTPRSLWTAMGFPRPSVLQARASRDVASLGNAVLLVDRRAVVDPPDAFADYISADPLRWPWCALAPFGDGAAPAPRPVSIRGPLPASSGIMSDLEGSGFTIVESGKTSHANETDRYMRDLVWLAPDGSEIARDDLAYMHTFRLETPHGTYTPTRIHQPDAGPVVVDARPWSDRGRVKQPYMPAFHLTELQMPVAGALKPLLQSAPLAHRVAVFGIAPEPKSAVAKQFVTLTMHGLYDAATRLRDWKVITRYEAAKFFVLLDPPECMRSAHDARDTLMINWGDERPASHEIYPEVGAAITSAMRWQAPGLETLVRCVGLRITLEKEQSITGVVFIEPRSTESSGFALMEPIVYDLSVMSEFFGHAAGVLERCTRSDDPAATLFSQAGCAINPVVSGGRLTVDMKSVQNAADLLRSIAKDAADHA
jgi:hypothetical protein